MYQGSHGHWKTWKMAKKIPCMEKSRNLKNYEISMEFCYEMPVRMSLGFIFFPRSLDKY